MHIPELSRFLFELSENNHRPWFIMNKPRYDILRIEFLEFVSSLIQGISEFDPEIQYCDPKKSLFRINRDVRFGNDKSPYKTNFSASILPSGRKKPSEGGGPAYYFQIGSDHRLFFAVGEYMPPADRLREIRNHIVNDGIGFSKLIKNKTFINTFGRLQDKGKLVRPPKGFNPDEPHIAYLKYKSYIAWAECQLDEMYEEETRKKLLTSFKAALPLVTWLRSASSMTSTS